MVGGQRSGREENALMNFVVDRSEDAHLLRAEVCLGAASPKARIFPAAAFTPNARMLPPNFFLLSMVTVNVPMLCCRSVLGLVEDLKFSILVFIPRQFYDARGPKTSAPLTSVAVCDP